MPKKPSKKASKPFTPEQARKVLAAGGTFSNAATHPKPKTKRTVDGLVNSIYAKPNKG